MPLDALYGASEGKLGHTKPSMGKETAVYKWQAPSRGGIDGRKAGVCRSLVTGEIVTRKKLANSQSNTKENADVS